MMIEEQADDDPGRKEIKVKIPVKLHIWLHTQKVLTGRNICTAVTEALERYLEEHPEVSLEEAEAGDA